MKKMSEMTAEELRVWFPLTLVNHDPQWKVKYGVIKQDIEGILNLDMIARISHIGSTAVEGLVAKPIIDILLEIFNNGHENEFIKALSTNGWGLARVNRKEEPFSVMFAKGYSPDSHGFDDIVYHLHVTHYGNSDGLYFRDYLREHPNVAEEYGSLKRTIVFNCDHGLSIFDDAMYTEAKADFVKKYTDMAKKGYQDRYAATEKKEIK